MLPPAVARIFVAGLVLVALAAVAAPSARAKVPEDFNGDGKSDLLWRQASTGATVLWLMNGSSVEAAYNLGGSSDWSVVATGDFDGDGYADLIWRQASTGLNVMWLMNGAALPGALLQANLGGSSDWSIAATGDFNGDGKTDLIWRQASTGATVLWLMNGASVEAAYNIGGSPDWSVVATGDFNGDGYADLIWRQASTGATVLWLMNGASLPTVLSIASLGGSADWSVSLTGDFNGDGKTDLVWRQASTGATVVWFMNGASVTSVLSLGGSTDWSAIGAGDFNGGAITDIVWRQASTGTMLLWLLNGSTTIPIVAASAGIGGSSDWTFVAGSNTVSAPAAPSVAPAGVNATGATAQVTVSWTGVTGATFYNVYRSTTAGVKGSSIGAAAEAPFIDNTVVDGTTYYYEITAANPAGEGPPSSQTAGVTPMLTVPPPPTALGVEAGSGQVTIAWQNVPAQYGVTAYNIYRSTAPGVQGTLIDTDMQNGVQLGTSIIAYIDATAVNGTPYVYTVTAVNASGEGQPSPQSATATPGSTANLPVAPTGVSAVAASAQVVLSWNPVSGAFTYLVYRSTTQGTLGSQLAATVAPKYTDGTALNGTTYYYSVIATNAAGNGPSTQSGAATPTQQTGASYTVGFTLTGLSRGATVTVGDNWTTANGETLGAAVNGSYTFLVPIDSGGTYSVTITVQPPGQTCVVSNGTGTIASADVVVAVSCSGAAAATYVYVLNGYSSINGGSDIDEYAIGAGGVLNAIATPTTTAGCIPNVIAVDPLGRYVYVGTQEGDAVSSNTNLNCASNTVTGPTIEQYTVGAGGALVPMSPISVTSPGNPWAIAIDPSGRYMYVENGGFTISQFTIGAGGMLTPMSPATVATPSCTASGPSSIGVDSSGHYVYVNCDVDGTGGIMYQFSIGTSGGLVPLPTPTIALGAEVGGSPLVIDPSGKYLYVTGFLTILQFAIGAGGDLVSLSPASVSYDCPNPASMAVDPTTKFAYVACGNFGLYQFTIGSGGALSPMTQANAPLIQNWEPEFVTIDPSGQYLYAVGGNISGTSQGPVVQYVIGAGGGLTLTSPPAVHAGDAPIGIAIAQ